MVQKKRSTRLAKSKIKGLSHPVAASLNLLHQQHSGHIVHRRHTSWGILLILLVITGFFIFLGYDMAAADTLSDSGSMSVGMTVNGNPPTTGATITSPTDGTTTSHEIITVSGTCEASYQVVVYSNDDLVGSTTCTSAAKFTLNVQLFSGLNNLTALDYDGLNQAGPVTPTVHVTYTPPSGSTSSSTPSASLPVYPVTGNTPTPPKTCTTGSTDAGCQTVSPGKTTCDKYAFSMNLPYTTGPRVMIACLPQNADTSSTTTIGIVVWGGLKPYALTINWGDGTVEALKSVMGPGYFTASNNYKTKGEYDIQLRVSDNNENQAYTQGSLTVSGTPPKTFVNYVTTTVGGSWFDSPVPIYVIALAIVLGFWAGDYFERLLRRRSDTPRHA